MDICLYMSKIKGTGAERELIKILWGAGWACIRSAGSGSTRYPSPDILAGNRIRRVALEVKLTKDKAKYFSDEEIKQLIAFAAYFGAEPWIAIKFTKSGWIFVNPEDLVKTAKGYVFKSESFNGLNFEEFVK